MRSKRKSLRFNCCPLPVTYRTAYEDGEGILENISTNGCALKKTTTKLEVGDAFLLLIEDQARDTAIQAQARVVRAEHGAIGACFTRIEPETQRAIRTFFAAMNSGSSLPYDKV